MKYLENYLCQRVLGPIAPIKGFFFRLSGSPSGQKSGQIMSFEDWVAQLDDSSGATYYFNTATGESSWEKPEGWLDEAEAAETETGAEALVEENPWTEVLDEGSNQVYYFNTVTGESSWEKPEGLQSQNEPDSPPQTTPQDGLSDSPPLADEDNPSNWEEVYDESNQAYYYVNNVTETTQWEKPDCMGAPAEGAPTDQAAAGSDEQKDDTFALHDDDDDGDRRTSKAGGAIVSLLFESLTSAGDLPKAVSGNSDESKQEAKSYSEAAPTYLDMQEQPVGNSNTTVPLVDVTNLAPDAPLVELSGCIGDISFEQFAAKHFNRDASNDQEETKHTLSGATSANFIRRASRRSTLSDSGGGPASTPGPLEAVRVRGAAPVSWSGEPIRISLCVMTDPELTESAVKLNRHVLGFMGDRKTKKTQQELVKSILEECLKKKSKTGMAETRRTSVRSGENPLEPAVSYSLTGAEQLRDELFCQILRQLRHNPSISSEEKGWHLFLICLACFSPSLYLTPYLISHFIAVLNKKKDDLPKKDEEKDVTPYGGATRTGAEALQVELYRKKEEIRRLAELTIRTLLKSIKASPTRSHVPTPGEISSIKSGKDLDVKVYFSDGESITVKVSSWTTVGDLTSEVGSRFGVSKGNMRIFTVYEVSTTGEEHALPSEDRVADVISFHYFDSVKSQQATEDEVEAKPTNSFSFVFKARLFFDCTAAGALCADDDEAATKLLYAQAVHDVISGKYPLLRAEATVLAGIQAQELFGNYLTDKSHNAMKSDAVKADTTEGSSGAVTRSGGANLFDSTSLAKFVCREYAGDYGDDVRRQKLREEVLRSYLKLHGLSPLEARRSYLTLLRGCKLYGAAFYKAENVSALKDRDFGAGKVIIAITGMALVIVDPVTRKCLLEYRMSHMRSWGYSASNVVIEIKTKRIDGAIEDTVDDESDSDADEPNSRADVKKIFRLMFTTPAPKIIADLLRDYNCPQEDKLKSRK